MAHGIHLCECGCGQPTRLARQSSTRRGWTKGQPVRFILGHGNRKHPHGWDVIETGYKTPCWLWRGEKTRHGYAKRGNILVHREMWEERHGPMPDGLEPDHLCRQRSCIRPDHLEPVTHAENMRRGSQVRVTPLIVEQIRASVGSLREIGRQFGVSHVTVLHIRDGRRWT